LATSSISATRLLGSVSTSVGSIRASASRAISVRTQPGETMFVRITGASSTASDITSECSAPLDAA